MESVMDTLAKYAQDLLTVALPIIAVAVLNWLKGEFERRKLGGLIDQYAPMVVRAAEQLELGKVITDKKAYALKRLDAILTSHGVKIDESLIELAVEAAVMEEFNKWIDSAKAA